MTEVIDTGFDDVAAGNIYKPDAELGHPISAEGAEIFTATVTAPGLTEAGKVAALELIGMPKITTAELAQLARELAQNIRPRSLILADLKLSETHYEFLEANNPFFAAALKQACIEWNSPMSIQDRLKLESAAILEDSLPGLGARMQNKGEGLPGVTEMAKLLAKIAGVGEREVAGPSSAERFVINIDLGADKKITLSTEAAQSAPAAPRAQLAFSTNSEVEGDLDPL